MNTYVIRKGIVSESLVRLREQRIHALFSGYLCLQRRAAQLERLENLHPDFLDFFKDFFFVKNHPLGTPYIKPFIEQNASTKNLWLNENVAGSYAPSSLRPDQPFRKVVKIDKKEYSLPSDHADRALKYLLHDMRVPVVDLAILLYRDYGLVGDSFSIYDLIEVFAYEFGYLIDGSIEFTYNFNTLYSLARASSWNVDWLEQL